MLRDRLLGLLRNRTAASPTFARRFRVGPVLLSEDHESWVEGQWRPNGILTPSHGVQLATHGLLIVALHVENGPTPVDAIDGLGVVVVDGARPPERYCVVAENQPAPLPEVEHVDGSVEAMVQLSIQPLPGLQRQLRLLLGPLWKREDGEHAESVGVLLRLHHYASSGSRVFEVRVRPTGFEASSRVTGWGDRR